MNDAGGRQFLQALRQHGSGNQRNGRQEVTKGPRAIIQLADDQRRPSIAEDLRRLCDGAKLTVSDHAFNQSRWRQATGLLSVLTLKTNPA